MIIIMMGICNPTYSEVDDLLELLTKSKSLHILMVMDKKNEPIRFSNLKKLVDSSSTTISRRLKELEAHGLVTHTLVAGLEMCLNIQLPKTQNLSNQFYNHCSIGSKSAVKINLN